MEETKLYFCRWASEILVLGAHLAFSAATCHRLCGKMPFLGIDIQACAFHWKKFLAWFCLLPVGDTVSWCKNMKEHYDLSRGRVSAFLSDGRLSGGGCQSQFTSNSCWGCSARRGSSPACVSWRPGEPVRWEALWSSVVGLCWILSRWLWNQGLQKINSGPPPGTGVLNFTFFLVRRDRRLSRCLRAACSPRTQWSEAT